jgi:hypothetical protein
LDDPFSDVTIRLVFNNTLSNQNIKVDLLANLKGTRRVRQLCGGGRNHRFAAALSLPPPSVEAVASNRAVVRAFAIDLIHPNITTELTNSPMLILKDGN